MGLMEIRRTRPSRRGLWLPLLGVFVCAAGAMALAVLSTILSEPSTAEESGDLTTITYGLTLLPSGIDPHIHQSAELGIPLHSVYDTLVYRHPQTFEFVPGLAIDLPEISPDGLSYTFQLRQDVTFHDGTPFNADAVGVTLDRILDPETGSQKSKSLLGPFLGYNLYEDAPYRITLILSEPYTPLLDALSQPYLGIASPTALANTSDATYQAHQVGTGPYRFVEYVHADRLVLERNSDYAWGPSYYADYADNSVDRIIFRFYEAPETRLLALESGAVDVIGELPPTDAELLLRNRDFKLHPQPIPGQPLQFYFNTQSFPTDDLLVRQALLYATNREAIVGTVFYDQYSSTGYGPLSASMPYYDASVETMYRYSPEQARNLFTRANVEDTDGDGILEKNGQPLQLRVVFAGFGFLPEVTQLLESQWRSMGIEVELIQVGSFPDLIEYARNGEFNLLAINDFGADPSIINRFYLSDGSSNWSRYSDPELDTWLREATQTPDQGRRAELYSATQRRIMEQAIVLPIRDYTNIVGLTTRIDGLIYTGQGWWPLLTNLVYQ